MGPGTVLAFQGLCLVSESFLVTARGSGSAEFQLRAFMS